MKHGRNDSIRYIGQFAYSSPVIFFIHSDNNYRVVFGVDLTGMSFFVNSKNSIRLIIVFSNALSIFIVLF